MQAVVESVLEGWSIALADPVRALDACLHADPALDRVHQAAQLRAIRALAERGAGVTRGMGYPDPEHTARAAQAMVDLGYPVAPDLVESATDVTFWIRATARGIARS